MDFAVRAGARPDNPCRRHVPAGGEKIGDGAKFLAAGEFALLLDKVPARYKVFVQYLVTTATRFGEATAVTSDDLKLHSHIATGQPPLMVKNCKSSVECGAMGPPLAWAALKRLVIRGEDLPHSAEPTPWIAVCGFIDMVDGRPLVVGIGPSPADKNCHPERRVVPCEKYWRILEMRPSRCVYLRSSKREIPYGQQDGLRSPLCRAGIPRSMD